MKPNLATTGTSWEAEAGGVAPGAQPAPKPAASARPEVSEHFRRLHSDEVVSIGDFVKVDHQGFELWEGPGGFRAASFVKPIYRRQKSAGRN